MREFSIEFLTRSGCHLCDEARPIVLASARQLGVGVDEVDIDESDDLTGRYGLRIPVVRTASGLVLAEGAVAPKTLVRAIKKARRAVRRQG